MRAAIMLILVGVGVGGLLFLMLNGPSGPEGGLDSSSLPTNDVVTGENPESAVRLSRRPLSRAKTDSEPESSDSVPGLLDGLNSPGGTIVRDLEIVDYLLFSYHSVLHEFPYGENADWVRAFLGSNRRDVAFFTAQKSWINDEQELIDRWATPFYFHRLSGDQIEIRSAGPDKMHWTDDDYSSVRSEATPSLSD